MSHVALSPCFKTFKTHTAFYEDPRCVFACEVLVPARPRAGRAVAPHRADTALQLEARLLHFDLVVLGGLDESIWPLATDSGPWMGRPMRARFGLPQPSTPGIK
jgi:hypothetical protein